MYMYVAIGKRFVTPMESGCVTYFDKNDTQKSLHATLVFIVNATFVTEMLTITFKIT